MNCLTVADVARRWSCSPGFVRQRLAAGDLPHLRLGERMIRIPITEVEAYEQRCPMNGPASPELQDARPGTSTTPAVVSLRAARIAQRLRPSSRNTSQS